MPDEVDLEMDRITDDQLWPRCLDSEPETECEPTVVRVVRVFHERQKAVHVPHEQRCCSAVRAARGRGEGNPKEGKAKAEPELKKGGLKRRQTDAEQLYERVLKHRTCRWRKEKRKRASKDNNCLQTLGCRWNEQGKALGRMGIG
jgi:hypothetical protein